MIKDNNSTDDHSNKNHEHKEDIVRFRPHHFMCTLSFRGKGYSLGFVKNYKKIVAKLNSDENTMIEVAEYMDDICAPCPNKLDNTICKIQNKIVRLDKNHAEILDIKPGDRMSWGEAKQRIKEKMSVEKFDNACSGCQWKPYGLCEMSLKELINSK